MITISEQREIWKTQAAGKSFLCTFLKCSQMPGVFIHSLIHGLGLYLIYNKDFTHRKTIKHFFYVLNSDFLPIRMQVETFLYI